MGFFTSSPKKSQGSKSKHLKKTVKELKKYLSKKRRSRKRKQSSSSSSMLKNLMKFQTYKYQSYMNHHQPWGYRAPPVHSNWNFLRQEAPRVDPQMNQTMTEYSKLLTEATQKVTESRAALEAALKAAETANQSTVALSALNLANHIATEQTDLDAKEASRLFESVNGLVKQCLERARKTDVTRTYDKFVQEYNSSKRLAVLKPLHSEIVVLVEKCVDSEVMKEYIRTKLARIETFKKSHCKDYANAGLEFASFKSLDTYEQKLRETLTWDALARSPAHVLKVAEEADEYISKVEQVCLDYRNSYAVTQWLAQHPTAREVLKQVMGAVLLMVGREVVVVPVARAMPNLVRNGITSTYDLAFGMGAVATATSMFTKAASNVYAFFKS
jgi:hypothetical protein